MQETIRQQSKQNKDVSIKQQLQKETSKYEQHIQKLELDIERQKQEHLSMMQHKE